MLKLGGIVEDGQNVQRAKYIISSTVPNSNTITLNATELIPINWEGKLVTQPSLTVNELGKQLLKAASDGTVDKVKQLLTKGAPFTADWLGTSPLHLAAQNNNLEITEILLRAGISKDARTKVDRTPLHMAAYEGHIEIVNTLIRHGADINCRDLLDMTPLHWAVQNGHFDVVSYLVHSGALIEVSSKFDVTPIMIAQQTTRPDIEQVLVEGINNLALAAQNLVLQLNAESAKENETGTMFNENMELETPNNEDMKEFTLIGDPILIDDNSRDNDGETTQEELEQEMEPDEHLSNENEQVQNVDTSALSNSLKILQEHGITMLQNDENDDGNILNSVMESGHSVVLTDVGKEVLNSVKQSEQRNKQSQPLQMNKKIVSVLPEQFFAMTNNSKTYKQLKIIPARSTFKRVVMRKNKIIPISTSTVSEEYNSIPFVYKENPTQSNLELVMNQLIEARKTIEEYKIKLRRKEQEAETYKRQLKLFMDAS